jgi:GR25 family glycosyltransferase involved in LPS biosynthesis
VVGEIDHHIPIAIVAHPRRNRMANMLANQVGAEAIVWDVGEIGAASNHLQAWEYLAGTGAEWGVVLEDDVIPCRDFYRNLAKAIEVSPLPILSLYLGRGRPPQWQQSVSRAITQDVSFITAPVLLSAQGYAMRTELLADHKRVGLFATRIRRPIDEAISYWATKKRKREGDKFAYCRFSLVDHWDGPTLIEDHGDGRGRNGLTDLMAGDCDPSGSALPEIRKAWLMAGPSTDWSRGCTRL